MANTWVTIHTTCLAVLLPPCITGSTVHARHGHRRRRPPCAAAATVADILSAHNAARREVGVAPLTWSTQIAGLAKRYAQSRRADCAPRRSSLFNFGENVAVGKGRRWNAAALVAQWVDERRMYDHGTASCASPAGMSGCARYTQVVWRDTTQLGCGKIVCDSGDTMLVCDYFPPGNYGTGPPY